MRWFVLFIFLLAVPCLSFGETVTVDPGNNGTLFLSHLCKGSEVKFIVPAGITEFRIQIQNVNEEYCCQGPFVTGVFSCSSASISDSDAVNVENIVSFYSPDGTQVVGYEADVDKTFKMDPISGSTLLLYFSSDSPTTKDCYFLLKMDSYVDSIQVYVTKTGATGSWQKDFGCKAADYCEKCPESNGTPGNMPSSAKKYSSGSSTSSSSSSSSSSTENTECHWERRCEPCVTDCGPGNCHYVKVCKKVPSSNPTPSSCTACSGSRVNPPFNFNPKQQQEPQQRGSGYNPFAGFFTPKSKYGVSGSSSSTGSSSAGYYDTGSYSTGKETAVNSLSGQKSYECDGSCLSDPNSPKFYTSYSTYAAGEDVISIVYVPKYDRPVDVYLGVEEVGKNVIWIVTVSGDTAIAYRYSEGGTIKPYAKGVKGSLNEWFHLSRIMPLVRGTYRMYILVVPKDTSLDSLGDYVLTYYDFNVQ